MHIYIYAYICMCIYIYIYIHNILPLIIPPKKQQNLGGTKYVLPSI